MLSLSQYCQSTCLCVSATLMPNISETKRFRGSCPKRTLQEGAYGASIGDVIECDVIVAWTSSMMSLIDAPLALCYIDSVLDTSTLNRLDSEIFSIKFADKQTHTNTLTDNTDNKGRLKLLAREPRMHGYWPTDVTLLLQLTRMCWWRCWTGALSPFDVDDWSYLQLSTSPQPVVTNQINPYFSHRSNIGSDYDFSRRKLAKNTIYFENPMSVCVCLTANLILGQNRLFKIASKIAAKYNFCQI